MHYSFPQNPSQTNELAFMQASMTCKNLSRTITNTSLAAPVSEIGGFMYRPLAGLPSGPVRLILPRVTRISTIFPGKTGEF